tara:strand:+ start:181 stop:600 length:420 start_codon:yes stop_codon:yes gene_type:complete
MRYGELIGLLMVGLQGLLKKNLKINEASFQQIIAIFVIPDSGIEMTALSKILGIDNSTATRLIAGLEKKDWVKKSTSLEDKRVVLVYITKKGHHVQKQIENQLDVIGESVEKIIRPKERQELLSQVMFFYWKLSKMVLK